MTTPDAGWFTEIWESAGCSFSLQIKSLLHCENSAFQKIEIFETTHFGKLMVLDGCIMLSDRDNFIYHEMMCHPALFTHSGAKDVLIVGGGDCGTLTEILKHKTLRSVTQVEIDERVTQLSRQYFPHLCAQNKDPRALLLFADGVDWVRNAAPKSQDLLIVDCTDPAGAAADLYSPKFYRNCYSVLRSGGILVQQTGSPLLDPQVIVDTKQNLNDAGFSAFKTLLFPQPVYPSGWWSACIARKDASLETFRESGASKKDFDSRYYNVETHKAALAVPEFLGKILGKGANRQTS